MDADGCRPVKLDIGFVVNPNSPTAKWSRTGMVNQHREALKKAGISAAACRLSRASSEDEPYVRQEELKKKGFKKSTLKKTIDADGNECYEAVFTKGGI